VIYGAAIWLFAGLVVMPLLGLRETLPPATAAGAALQPVDPMLATVMMYTLGPLASIAALIAWVLFGAILGAAANLQKGRDAMLARTPAR
jgi:type IV secretory pathway VirB2 component (pilin)